jgi:hypothetical protein
MLTKFLRPLNEIVKAKQHTKSFFSGDEDLQCAHMLEREVVYSVKDDMKCQ